MSNWYPDSWRNKRVDQEVIYPDPVELNQAVGRLSTLPPLVTSWEIENLKSQLAEAIRLPASSKSCSK
jgi:3-deoxy-7-phosphoheptulonate synthase